MTDLPLSGVRVVDLSQRLPGGYCTMLLADYGAEVIKVEPPTGDFTRSVPPNIGEDGAVHWIVNRNKKSITLDLKLAGDRAQLLELVATADVVVEGYRPGVAARLGADYATLKRVRSDLVYCSITGYGQDSPQRDEPSHDINYLAASGFLGLSAWSPAAAPPLPPIPIADLCAGSLMAVTAILLALIERSRSGRGQYVDVAMTDGLLALLPIALGDVAAGAGAPQHDDLVVTGAYPCYGTFPTADGRWLTLGLLEPDMWERFCRKLEREDWIDRQFDASAAEPIKDELVRLFRGRSSDDWRAFFADADLALAPVLSFGEALASVHVRSRELLTRMADRSGSPRIQLRPPLRLSATPGRLRLPAPLLGEHNPELLGRAVPSARRARRAARDRRRRD